MKTYKIIYLIFALLLLVGLTFGQSVLPYTSLQTTQYTSTGIATSINLITSGTTYHKITWTISGGTLSACTVAVDSAPDNITWTAGGAVTAQTCTSNGTVAAVSGTFNYVRVNVTAFTSSGGTPVLTVQYTGYANNPAAGGGSAFAGGLGTSYQDVTEIAAPANPSAGNDRIYTNSTTHQLSCLTSAGLSCSPTGGSGTVSANSTTNAHASAVYTTNGGSTTVVADTSDFTDGAGNHSAVSYTTTGSNGGSGGTEGTGVNAPCGASKDCIWPDSTDHRLKANNNNGALTGDVAIVIASGNGLALGTSAIASGACATVVTASATGAATTDVLSWNPSADWSAITGYAPVTTGSLIVYWYVTLNTANFKVCNPTSSSITPGAASVNWAVRR